MIILLFLCLFFAGIGWMFASIIAGLLRFLFPKWNPDIPIRQKSTAISSMKAFGMALVVLLIIIATL